MADKLFETDKLDLLQQEHVEHDIKQRFINHDWAKHIN